MGKAWSGSIGSRRWWSADRTCEAELVVIVDKDVRGRQRLETTEAKQEKPSKAESRVEHLSLQARVVFLCGEITHAVARTTCERLITLAQESDVPINVLISSPGG